MDIPLSEEFTNNTIYNGIHVINDTKNDVTVLYLNSANCSQTTAAQFAYIRDSYAINTVKQSIANETVLYNEENKTYMAFLGNSNTHDNILIICNDENILEYMISSINYTQIDNGFNGTGTQESFTGIDSTLGSDSSESKGSSNLSSVPEGYYWSGQYGDYIKEYTDSKGLQHISHLNGDDEFYNPNNGKYYVNGVEKVNN